MTNPAGQFPPGSGEPNYSLPPAKPTAPKGKGPPTPPAAKGKLQGHDVVPLPPGNKAARLKRMGGGGDNPIELPARSSTPPRRQRDDQIVQKHAAPAPKQPTSPEQPVNPPPPGSSAAASSSSSSTTTQASSSSSKGITRQRSDSPGADRSSRSRSGLFDKIVHTLVGTRETEAVVFAELDCWRETTPETRLAEMLRTLYLDLREKHQTVTQYASHRDNVLKGRIETHTEELEASMAAKNSEAERALQIFCEENQCDDFEMAEQRIQQDIVRTLLTLLKIKTPQDPEFGNKRAAELLAAYLPGDIHMDYLVNAILEFGPDSYLPLMRELMQIEMRKNNGIPLRGDHLMVRLIREFHVRSLRKMLKPVYKAFIAGHIQNPRDPKESARVLLQNICTGVSNDKNVTARQNLADLYSIMRQVMAGSQECQGRENAFLANSLCLRLVNYLMLNPELLKLDPIPQENEEGTRSMELQACSDISIVCIKSAKVGDTPQECFQDPDLGPLWLTLIDLLTHPPQQETKKK